MKMTKKRKKKIWIAAACVLLLFLIACIPFLQTEFQYWNAVRNWDGTIPYLPITEKVGYIEYSAYDAGVWRATPEEEKQIVAWVNSIQRAEEMVQIHPNPGGRPDEDSNIQIHFYAEENGDFIAISPAGADTVEISSSPREYAYIVRQPELRNLFASSPGAGSDEWRKAIQS